MNKSKTATADMSPSQAIDARIHELGDWRGKLLARLRSLITATDAKVIEEWKWNIPVWSRDGIICTGESYKDKIKLTFARGASVADPKGLFNSSLEGNTRRAIDFYEDDRVNEAALKALIRSAIKVNMTGATKQKGKRR